MIARPPKIVLYLNDRTGLAGCRPVFIDAVLLDGSDVDGR